MPQMISELSTRADIVLSKINSLKSALNENILDLGELLSEVKSKQHYQAWGYDSLDSWIEHSGLDMGTRHAYYIIKIVDTAKELGIPKDELAKVKMSKLKAIFSLKGEDKAKIKELVGQAETMPLEDVQKAVQKVKDKDRAWEDKTWRNFHLFVSQAEVVDKALERAKMESGSLVDANTGEVVDISDNTALERVCADYLASPNETEYEYENLASRE